ncbi:MAG: gfo/Idh/MocA family oxidoreductase, partial [Planctomycetota bacterium]
GSIFENFINCVRSRDRSKLYADVLEAHYSAACCHLGNISYRLGKQVPGATRPDVFGQHDEIPKSWETIQTTVKGTLGLELDESTYQLGATLDFDPETEKFVGDDEANKLVTRDYRDPFAVTEEV